MNMRIISIAVGIILDFVGFGGFVMTGMQYPTALIPSAIGMVVLLCGILGLKASEHARKHIMHVAVLAGLLGFGGTVPGLLQLPSYCNGTAEHPAAVLSKSITCIVCAVYVGLCVKSFIDVRRARTGYGN